MAINITYNKLTSTFVTILKRHQPFDVRVKISDECTGLLSCLQIHLTRGVLYDSYSSFFTNLNMQIQIGGCVSSLCIGIFFRTREN